jgi:pimeloyl-ACP methyl ester carboxylesterase
MQTILSPREKESFFFGPPDSPLFGSYHLPRPQTPRRWGLVYFYPMGQEYMRFHRAYVQLAVRLARAGFPGLRFDYFGCGDSFGNHEEARLSRWLQDSATAVDEMQGRSHAANSCLIGARMGAALATTTGSERNDVKCLVLWNPIVNGKAHRDELMAMQSDMLRYSYVDPEIESGSSTSIEILGFPFSEELLADIETIDLLSVTNKPADKILLLDSASDPRVEQLHRHLEALGSQVTLRRFPGPELWLEEPFRAVVPNELWQNVTAWLSDALT